MMIIQPISGRRLSVSHAVTKLGHDSEEEQDREAVEKKAKKESALRRFGWDLTELAAKGAARVNAEPLKAEMLKWESRKHSGSLAAESRTLATAWQRW